MFSLLVIFLILVSVIYYQIYNTIIDVFKICLYFHSVFDYIILFIENNLSNYGIKIINDTIIKDLDEIQGNNIGDIFIIENATKKYNFIKQVFLIRKSDVEKIKEHEKER